MVSGVAILGVNILRKVIPQIILEALVGVLINVRSKHKKVFCSYRYRDKLG